MTPQEIARKCVDPLRTDDKARVALGMKIESVGPATAMLRMTVRESMTNGRGTCRDGYIFAFADLTFAFACNAYDQRCVAQHCSIACLAPAREGKRLRAIARERQRVGRNGVYDVATADETGAIIAELRSRRRSRGGEALRRKSQARFGPSPEVVIADWRSPDRRGRSLGTTSRRRL